MLELKQITPLLFVLAGTANILFIKWADQTYSEGSDGKVRNFEHPFLQTAFMFYGEFLCYIVFKILFTYFRYKNPGLENTNTLTAGGRDFPVTVFFIPAICSALSASMLFIGIYLTYVSTCQMLRAISIIFVGMFSVHYLNQPLNKRQWIGMTIISIGALFVTIVDVGNTYLHNDNNNNVENDLEENHKYSLRSSDPNAILTADLLIICSQIFQGVQYVYEEKCIKIHDIPPLHSAGFKGLFGFIITIFLIIPLNFIKVEAPFDHNANEVAEDIQDAFYQFKNNYILIISHGLFMISMALYTFSRLAIMKNSYSTNVVLLDNIRIVFIWLFALGLKWEEFTFTDLIGPIIILCGIFVYRNIVFSQIYRWILGRLARRRYGELDPDVRSQPADAI